MGRVIFEGGVTFGGGDIFEGEVILFGGGGGGGGGDFTFNI